MTTKTNDSTLYKVFDDYAEGLIQDLYEKHPSLRELGGAQLSTASSGFKSEDEKDIFLYNKVIAYQKDVMRISADAEKCLGRKPLMVILMDDLKELIMKTPNICMFLSVDQDGKFEVPYAFRSNITSRLGGMSFLKRNILTKKSFKEWLGAKSDQLYSETNEETWIKLIAYEKVSKYMSNFEKINVWRKNLIITLENFLLKQSVYRFLPHDDRLKPLWLYTDKDLRRLFFGNLYHLHKRFLRNKDVDVEKVFSEISQNFMWSVMNMEEGGSFKIFGKENTSSVESSVRFINSPLRINVALENIRKKYFHSIIIAERGAFTFDERIFESSSCPIIGYGTGPYVVLVDQFADLSVEQQLIKNAQKICAKRFLGVAYEN